MKLSGHARTLNAMRRHPRPSNLRWADIETLLEHLGAVVREGKGSAISVTLNGITAYFHRPHPGDKAKRWHVETALRLLEEGASIPTSPPGTNGRKEAERDKVQGLCRPGGFRRRG